MSEQLTITDVEIAKELPDWQGKGAKVFRYTVEGDDRRPEDFVVNGTEPKKVGDTIEGIEDGEYGPKVKKAPRGGGGFKKSPQETERIVRQHSQEMALRLCELFGLKPTEEEFHNYINWFVDDTYGKLKFGTNAWPMTSDVPADQEGLPL